MGRPAYSHWSKLEEAQTQYVVFELPLNLIWKPLVAFWPDPRMTGRTTGLMIAVTELVVVRRSSLAEKLKLVYGLPDWLTKGAKKIR